MGTAQVGAGNLAKTWGIWTATGNVLDTVIVCVGVARTAWAGTTGTSAKTCGAVVNIAIGMKIAVDTAFRTTETIEVGIAMTKIEAIEATIKIGLGGV